MSNIVSNMIPGVTNLTSEQSGLIFANHIGYIDYNDTSTTVTPLELTEDVWATIPNDGLGSFSRNELPVGALLPLTAEGGLDLSNLPMNSLVKVRMDFIIYPNVNNAFAEFGILLGSASPYRLEKTINTLPQGAGRGYHVGLDQSLVYIGDTNTKNGVALFQVKLSTGGTVVNAGMVAELYKTE